MLKYIPLAKILLILFPGMALSQDRIGFNEIVSITITDEVTWKYTSGTTYRILINTDDDSSRLFQTHRYRFIPGKKESLKTFIELDEIFYSIEPEFFFNNLEAGLYDRILGSLNSKEVKSFYVDRILAKDNYRNIVKEFFLEKISNQQILEFVNAFNGSKDFREIKDVVKSLGGEVLHEGLTKQLKREGRKCKANLDSDAVLAAVSHYYAIDLPVTERSDVKVTILTTSDSNYTMVNLGRNMLLLPWSIDGSSISFSGILSKSVSALIPESTRGGTNKHKLNTDELFFEDLFRVNRRYFCK